MFLNFFHDLRQAKIPVTLKEYLALMEGLDKKVIDMKVDEFYYLSRAALVKDERNLDKFDRVFAHAFKGLERPVVILAELGDKHLEDLRQYLYVGGSRARNHLVVLATESVARELRTITGVTGP